MKSLSKFSSVPTATQISLSTLLAMSMKPSTKFHRYIYMHKYMLSSTFNLHFELMLTLNQCVPCLYQPLPDML